MNIARYCSPSFSPVGSQAELAEKFTPVVVVNLGIGNDVLSMPESSTALTVAVTVALALLTSTEDGVISKSAKYGKLPSEPRTLITLLSSMLL